MISKQVKEIEQAGGGGWKGITYITHTYGRIKLRGSEQKIVFRDYRGNYSYVRPRKT